jgi:hypothetical protein
MELITDDFSCRVYHLFTVSRFRRDPAFTIAPDLDRAVKIFGAAI